MSRKSLFVAIGSALLLAGSAAAGVILLIRHEPGFYRRAAVPRGKRRSDCSDAFVHAFTQLVEGVLGNREWNSGFTDEQVNSYFEEDFVKQHGAAVPLPEGIREPRVRFEADTIRVGFRYGKGAWSTVVSMALRPWLVDREPNVVALEFQALHAGALPVAAQSLLDWVADVAHRNNIDSTWYRYNGHPVLLLRFQANGSNPSFQLLRLEIRPGNLLIVGRSLEAGPPPPQG